MEINYVHKGIIDSLVISYRIVVKLTYVYLLLLDVWFGVKCDWPGFCE